MNKRSRYQSLSLRQHRSRPTEAEEKPLSSFTTAEKDGVLLDGGMIFETDDYRSAGNDAYITDDEESDFYIAPEKLRRSHTAAIMSFTPPTRMKTDIIILMTVSPSCRAHFSRKTLL